MNRRHQVSLAPPPPHRQPVGAVLDVVPLGRGSDAVVSLDDGLVAVIDVARGEFVRTLRGHHSPDDLLTTRVASADAERVVLWGWENVEALDAASGANLWSDYVGHDLDDDKGRSAVVSGAPYVVLPNGLVVDVRDGRFDFEIGSQRLSHSDLTAWVSRPRGGAVVASRDGRIYLWVPRDADTADLALVATFDQPVLDLTCANDTLAVVTSDGAVAMIDLVSGAARGIGSPCVKGDEVVGAVATTLSDDGGRVAWSLGRYDPRTYRTRWLLRVGGEGSVRTIAEESPCLRDARTPPVPLWLSNGDLALVFDDRVVCYRIDDRGYDVVFEMPLGARGAASAVVDGLLVVGDESARLHVFELSAE